ncbi:ArgE/DapE family deacylase [Halopenitus persicus]|uniref:4-acetamidobutyryl-CoA deacetylase n=1 Tax=Halopenitus persicus TaxID=1048396 RepID=A0A1H3HD02_9EURY|nr:ArgE/DapE family deacylase [Halopenitus persicus]SDY12529.1 4-acetamidobutyryl-CoA deacetylase [Halopenitus persicus]
MHTEVRDRIAETQDRMLDFLGDLVAAESVSGREGPAQAVVHDRLAGHDLEIDTWEPSIERLRDHPGFFETVSYEEYGYEGRENLVATRAGSGDGRSLTLSGHVDVVNPNPVADWEYDPWAATVTDGRVYGRGALDMKGGIAAFIHAFEVLEELDVDLAGDLHLQTTIEEESGGTGGVLSALERGYRPDAAIIAEPFGIPNVGIAGAGVSYFRITVPGEAAHTAFKYAGENALGHATRVYQALEALDERRRERIEYQPAVNQDPRAEGSVTNLSVSVMEAGDWISKVPGEAVLTGRVGWPPGETSEEVRAEIAETVAAVAEEDPWLSEHPPEIEWFGWDADPHEVDTEEAIVRLATEHAEAVTGGQTEYVGGLGGLDERFYQLYYDIPAISLGPRGANAHGADEHVEIDSLVETAQAIALTAMDWCGVAEEN